ncbi:MAG: hypothetical protein QOI54_606 [Actinomycetota bacterium]|jgi:hypothetical protein|nr:hypothetical protein [Actinomycetota bacterium]
MTSNHEDDRSHHDDRAGDAGDAGIAARLRDALSSEAAMVQPAGDGLQKIRDGVAGGGRWWWRHPAVALVAAAVLGLAVSGVYVGLRDGSDGTTVVADQSQSPTPSEPSSTPSPTSASPSESPSPTRSEAARPAYVYYIHDDGQDPRLFREQHQVTGDGELAALALRWMMAKRPEDPDYTSPWADTGLRGYTRTGDTATVELSTFVSVPSKLERAAVQEIVYTVTANDRSVKNVRLRVQGQAPQGHRDWSQPVHRAPMVDVQGLIWLLAPAQGSVVGSPVTIDGFGTAFEGTITWEVRRAGAVVQQGTAQGGANGQFGQFHATVTLDPGDYELSAFESSAENGEPLHIDTKSFTVR